MQNNCCESNKTASNCCCSQPEVKLIFPCSGSSDVGEIADKTARLLTKSGAGKMYCLAGIGGRVSAIMASTEAVDTILVIDGCPQQCAKKTLLEAGFTNFQQILLTEHGFQKGMSPATEINLKKAATICLEQL